MHAFGDITPENVDVWSKEDATLTGPISPSTEDLTIGDQEVLFVDVGGSLVIDGGTAVRGGALGAESR